MLEYALRFLVGGIAVSAFAALGDTLRPKSFAGLFGAAPSIALATLLITLSQKDAASAKAPTIMERPSAAANVDRDDGSSGGLVRSCVWANGAPVSALMIVQFKPSALRQMRWHEYVVRWS
jgi:hypothetical protein